MKPNLGEHDRLGAHKLEEVVHINYRKIPRLEPSCLSFAKELTKSLVGYPLRSTHIKRN